MRKIILAAAIATSALGLAACSGETATTETTDEMAADAEANADAMPAEGETAVEAAADATVDAAEATADAATAAADAAAATAEAATEAAE